MFVFSDSDTWILKLWVLCWFWNDFLFAEGFQSWFSFFFKRDYRNCFFFFLICPRFAFE